MESINNMMGRFCVTGAFTEKVFTVCFQCFCTNMVILMPIYLNCLKSSFQGLVIITEIFMRNMFLYDFDIQEGEYVGKLDKI